MIYHVDNTWLPGGFVGVDIFFVLSGFLITGIWIKDIESASWRMLPEFWGRRILRLLPAATLVLSVTALASAWVMPAADRGHIAEGIRAATFYMANIFYANDSLDYLATDVSASPVLHFWSLGVEEQFYVVWPTLFLLSLGFSKNTRRTRWILVVIAAVSFGLSIYQTKTVQPYAFFGAPARAWQLGVGALLALNYHHFGRVWPRVRGLLGTFGLVLIGIAFFKMAVIIESGWQYPGVPALLPTLGEVLADASNNLVLTNTDGTTVTVREAVAVCPATLLANSKLTVLSPAAADQSWVYLPALSTTCKPMCEASNSTTTRASQAWVNP